MHRCVATLHAYVSVCVYICVHTYVYIYIYMKKYIYKIHNFLNNYIYTYSHIYLCCIYLLMSSSVLFHAPMIHGEHEALVRGKPSKLKLGSVFSFEMQSPTTFIP